MPADSGLTEALALLGKVLEAEIQAGCKNRATAGGIHAFFTQRFVDHAVSEEEQTRAERVLASLQRYEAASIAERPDLARMIIRRLGATLAQTGNAAPTEARGAHQALVRENEAPPSLPVDRSRRPEPHPLLSPPTPPTSGREEQLQPASASPAPASRPQPEAMERAVAPEEPPSPNTPLAASLDIEAAEALGSPARERQRLEQLGITTLRSALEYWPRDHYDYSAPVRINRMYPDMQVTLVGTLRSVDIRRTANRNLQIIEAKISDPTGLMSVTWFNQPYLLKTLKPREGEQVAVSGKVELKNGRLQLAPRDVEFPADEEAGTNTMRVVPIYPSSEGIAQRWLRKLIRRAVSAGGALITDPLPPEIRTRFGLPDRRAAVLQYHFPESLEERDRARNRLALDELLLIQLGMLQRKHEWQEEGEGRSIAADPEVLSQFRASLPFTLTGAQDTSLAEILTDMSHPTPMSRLLQGDVGSGKTVVAAAALLLCARAGMQGTIMAPTEILAEQHARTLRALLEPHGVSVTLLTGSLTKAQRARAYLDAVEGRVQILVGTHALIQNDFKFNNLGLAIVDEQHRFGVAQRAALKGKGFNPHLLVMTATPIPRTLTLTIFGDLDVSIIGERPPNRQPVETRWAPVERQAFDLIREQIQAGRQAYIICPLVEESEAIEAKAAVAEGKRLQEDVFPELRLEVLHGKLRPQDKDAILGRFRDGELDILVATSVVEVGIDVPNATVMVVQDAQRFGLAQLHQFRGRVGRGAEKSYCLLLADATNPVARERLQALCATDDGFKLAEEDLRLRGPGEFWGTRQSGIPALQVAQVTDIRTLDLARHIAENILADDPTLDAPEHAALAEGLRQFWRQAAAPS
ncbi:MAG TPA: ATP-dependent DNA helicase RecG [Chloroflexota bacterium]|nr:ATP-dependent DNA helicase RecG [Chloroflexota bacterium]